MVRIQHPAALSIGWAGLSGLINRAIEIYPVIGFENRLCHPAVEPSRPPRGQGMHLPIRSITAALGRPLPAPPGLHALQASTGIQVNLATGKPHHFASYLGTARAGFRLQGPRSGYPTAPCSLPLQGQPDHTDSAGLPTTGSCGSAAQPGITARRWAKKLDFALKPAHQGSQFVSHPHPPRYSGPGIPGLTFRQGNIQALADVPAARACLLKELTLVICWQARFASRCHQAGYVRFNATAAGHQLGHLRAAAIFSSCRSRQGLAQHRSRLD